MTQIFPQSVKGKIRNLKWLLNTVFLLIYLGAPFLRYDRGDSTPNQAILIDFENSMGYFFGIEMWPDDVYYLMVTLIMAALVLFFVTSLFGRIWCGYACFQTVWSDIFIAIERFFQGDRNQRILLERKNSFKKYYSKLLTHICWLVVAMITGYGFTAYFSDAFEQLELLKNFNLSQTVILWSLGIAGMTYLMAGFAREAVCLTMCPYARFQSVMFDRDTLIVTYDEKRGEPRGGMKDKNRGDCIDCKQCVVVCPVGIDIRDGLQMECIACGLCIDACNGIMDKINQPRGLIRYDTQNHLSDPKKYQKFRIFKPRFFYYLTLITLIVSMATYSIVNKAQVLTSIKAKRNPPYVMMSDGSLRNSYNLKVTNKTHQDKIFIIRVKRPKFAKIEVSSYLENINENNLIVKKADSTNFRLFINIDDEDLNKDLDRGLIELELIDKDTKEIYEIEAVFVDN